MNTRSYSQIYTHEETGYNIEIIAQSLENLGMYTDTFILADKIVGAQFYYTNPILYLIGNNIDKKTCAPLYDNIYLMNTKTIKTTEFDGTITAVNSIFLERIGSYGEVSTDIASDFEKYSNEYGLYLVGIDISETDPIADAEQVSE